MRELFLTALLACVSAAPSILAPYPYALPIAVNGVAPLVAAPTISPGDIAAVAIDAQVKLADQARYISDEAKDKAEQAVEKQNQDVRNANDLAKEKEEEAIWAAEEKKWQVINEVQIAEARIAGSIASKVDPEAISTGAKSEEKAEIKSEATEVKTEEKAEITSEVMEVKSEEKLEVKPAEAEKPVEVAMPAEAMKENAIEVKAVTPETAKLEEAFTALNSALAPIALAPGFNYKPYVTPISYSQYPAYSLYPFQHFLAIPYQPTLAVKKVL
ncbi:pupal cuticle protein PCP52-like [Maniola hyperantus]|uniref:pupal cuticle protein PCP52-like n=1 Tax=Aphantopus hyperantus TaxID=2795564 RepID=UPI0015693AD6|nr:pupal cuticle protein PCP52-like [Maniola hyperantus]